MTSVPSSNRLCWRLQLLTLGAENPTPEFWFGDFVDFCWHDERTGEPHSETGVIVGVVWNHTDQEWQYMVTWLASTIDLDSNYPIFSQELVPEETLCKL